MAQRASRSTAKPAVRSTFEGGCLCGAVRYRVNGPALDSGSCHCRSCRKASSAPELPYAQFATIDFEFTRGWPAQYHSSPEVTRSFCRHCGSPLTYRHAGHPDRLDIMTCSLDDPDVLPPAYHVWTSHKPRWATIGDGLPLFETTRTKR
ncbi:MAG: GFA family protein [Reyranella sp.]|nr:GFA family protein [Reyranella sp.]